MTKARPDPPDFQEPARDRIRSRSAQVARLHLKLERTYHHWLTCRSPELKEALAARVAEFEDRIAHLERVNRASRE
jgi:hypothetical protein